MTDLTPAEQAAYNAMAPFMPLDPPNGLVRDIVAAARPLIAAEVLRDAADVLDQCADPRLGPLVRGIAWSAATLRHRADEQEQEAPDGR